MSKKILIVDDSRVSRMLIKAHLAQKAGDWTILEATSGDEALQIAKSERPDAFSLDFNMPGMDGLTLAEALKKGLPNAKIALFTANVQQAVRERGEAVGVVFIAKPVTDASAQLLLEMLG